MLKRIILLLACAACTERSHPAPPAQAASATTAAIAAPDSDVAAAQSAALLVTEPDTSSFIVVMDSTYVGDNSAPLPWRGDSRLPLDTLMIAEVRRDFEARNRSPVRVSLPPRIEMMDVKRFKAGDFFAHDDPLNWARFSEYFQVDHFYTVSRPGFDADRRHAALVVILACGDTCGTASLVVLERRSAGWWVIDSIPFVRT